MTEPLMINFESRCRKEIQRDTIYEQTTISQQDLGLG